jgi:hypothetical protein
VSRSLVAVSLLPAHLSQPVGFNHTSGTLVTTGIQQRRVSRCSPLAVSLPLAHSMQSSYFDAVLQPTNFSQQEAPTVCRSRFIIFPTATYLYIWWQSRFECLPRGPPLAPGLSDVDRFNAQPFAHTSQTPTLRMVPDDDEVPLPRASSSVGASDVPPFCRLVVRIFDDIVPAPCRWGAIGVDPHHSHPRLKTQGSYFQDFVTHVLKETGVSPQTVTFSLLLAKRLVSKAPPTSIQRLFLGCLLGAYKVRCLVLSGHGRESNVTTIVPA